MQIIVVLLVLYVVGIRNIKRLVACARGAVSVLVTETENAVNEEQSQTK